MVVGKRGLVLAFVLSCFLAQALTQLTPRDPRVGCPVGYTNLQTWFYNQKTNNRWGTLCRAYSTCSTGFRQSPINIPTSLSSRAAKLRLSLKTAAVNLIRTADYVTMPIESGVGALDWKGHVYTLNKIEFHSPSEHTLQGRYATLEVQLYFTYTRPDGRQTFNAAVAVLFNCGAQCDNGFFAKILPALPCRYRCECGNNRTEPYNPYGTEACDEGSFINNQNLPDRCRSDCQFPRCGDRVTDPAHGEECDTGANTTVAGQCRTNCRLPYCGDGITDIGEACDTGAWFEGSGCTGACTKECGDACLQPGEQCDFGIAGIGSVLVTGQEMSDAPNATRGVCRMNCYWARCGDNITDLGEQCDEGNYNFLSNDTVGGSWLPNSCRPNCTIPRCGDGVVDHLFPYLEQCDPFNNTLCSANCTWLCGNGVNDTNESCDMGSANSDIAAGPNATVCRSWASITPCRLAHCGDNITDFGEDCDDSGLETVRCFSNCTYRCGNRIIDAGEACDNGNPNKYPARSADGNSDTRPNACRANCQLYFCGDGITDDLGCEQCDTGALRSNTTANACRLNCKNPHCGDDVTDSGEECDDGNNVDDDGCSCCRRDCGNGIKQGGEDCDDGLANSNVIPDRCRTNCVRHFCGDGLTDSDEECDDGRNGTQFCTPSCTKTYCGDGVRQVALGEECDLGDLNSYSALDGCSPVCTLNKCGQTQAGTTVNLELLLPSVVGTFHYLGSNTRPPCTEGIQWFVVPQPRTMTAAQCRLFRTVIPTNSNRYLQGHYGRRVITAPTTGYDFPNDPRYGLAGSCGDGIVQHNEQCDDGIENDNKAPDACRTTCRAPSCGDGVKDAGEECDGEAYCKACKIDRRYRIMAAPHDGQCSANRQSPIRLPEACPRARALNLNHPSNVQYNPTPIILFNTGDEILFPATAGGTFSYKGNSYTLERLEFHEPSEHYIGNRRYPFEVQLFHKSQKAGPASYAVLSVLFAEGTTRNQFLQPILDRLPPVSHCRCGNGIKEDIKAAVDGTWVREECDDGALNNDRLPNRCRTNCRNAYCGDGVIDTKEQCDRGVWNANAPDRCRANCVLPYCGDGITDPLHGETCDDGNNVNGDGCNSNCRWECGDGVQNQIEQCDEGVYNSNEKSSGCRVATCRAPFCGDGIIDIDEECDDGANNNNTKANACRTNCKVPICGDNVVDAGEACDGGNLCTVGCTLLCGNGVVDVAAGEECDDGVANSNNVPNACRANCRLPRCGDLVRDDGEACDSSDARKCQACNVVCGNGILEAGEECDDGIYNSDTEPNACRTNCMLWSCGDGIFDALEECDWGVNNGNTSDKCRPWCRIPKCGDGIVDTARGETCDDGNTLAGDGCNCGCQKECGNGRVDPGEVCDEGPLNSDVRPACCRTNCRLPRCGDGITDPGEECDDGTSGNVDGPNTCRSDCKLPKCGDGIVDHLYGELCDQGGRNGLTVVDGCSPTCMPNLCRQSVHLNTTVNPGALLPTAPGTYHYAGSQTAHPCTENAEWFVFSTPVPISSCQLAQFRRVQTNNARCLQARNGRPVNFLEVCAKCGDGIVEGNEECDNGPANSDFAPNACRRNCRLPRCGDGVQDKGEQCDGTPNCSQTCSFSCPSSASGANATGASAAASVDTNEINVNFAKILG